PLAAKVPVGDVARGIEQVDRIIGYALHQHAKLMLVVGRLGVVRRAVDIPDHREPADAGAIGVRRLDRRLSGKAAAVLADEPALPGHRAVALRPAAPSRAAVLRRIAHAQPTEPA